jgi:hypothetical protein
MATMADLIVQVRRRTDHENSTFVGDDELQEYLNDSIAELYTELMARWGEEYFVDEEDVTIPAGANDEDGNVYPLVPGNFEEPPLRYLSVSLYQPGEERLVPLKQFHRQDTVITVGTRDWDTNPPRYRFLSLDAIEFDSAPSTEQQVIVRAVPMAPRYDKDDPIDIPELMVWREFAILDAMAKVMAKEESDTAAIESRKQLLLGRISANAPPRDAAEVKLIRDDRSLQFGDDWGWT